MHLPRCRKSGSQAGVDDVGRIGSRALAKVVESQQPGFKW